MDDAAAIRACRAGNVDAFRHFVDRYQARALAHARLLTRNDADAADAAQDAFFDAFRGLGAFDPSRPFYAWFYVLLRNRCLKQRARRGTRPESGMGRRAFFTEPLWEPQNLLDRRRSRTCSHPVTGFTASQGTDYGPFLDLVVRSDVSPAALTPALTQAVREAAPNSTVAYDTIRTYVRDSLVTERLMAILSGFFGGLAMLIATIGLYGVMSYTVSRRKVEIGLRMALGADPGTVVRMVIGESGRLLLWGVACGIGLAVLSSRWAASLLFGLRPWDPASLVTAVAVLSAVSLLAAWLPARRASRLTPTIALRDE